MRDASGNPFWSLGCDCVGEGTPWASYDPSKPSYSGSHLFPSGDAWAKDTLQNLRKWGFNSLGGWCDLDLLRKNFGKQPMPFTIVLHLGSYDHAPWYDMYAPEFVKLLDRAAADQIPKVRNDPNLIGYFTDNELGWWDDTLFLTTLDLPLASPGRHKLLSLLRSRYRGKFLNLRRDFVTSANSFEDLARRKSAVRLRPGGNGIQTVHAWVKTLAERYYTVVGSLIRKYDKRHLILGDRYAQYFTIPVAEAAAKHIDVASTNMGADWNDGTFSHFFLRALHEITGKPVMITEFYMAATGNRSGDKNSSDGFPVVESQRERASAFARNVSGLAALPYVVGAHWFQYYDEPGNGRADGEDYNMGLVDTAGRPYDDLVQACSALHVDDLHRFASRPSSPSVVPPSPANAMSGLKNWPRSTGWVDSDSRAAFADLYTCADREALYVGLYAMEYMDEKLYAGGAIPESERPQFTLGIAGLAQPISIRFMGKNRKPTVNTPAITVTEVPGMRHSLMIRIPAFMLGMRALEPNTRIQLAAMLTSHSRGYRTHWRTLAVIAR